MKLWSKIRNSSFLKAHGLTLATFAGVLLGVGMGLLLRIREEPWSAREVREFFIQLLKARSLVSRAHKFNYHA